MIVDYFNVDRTRIRPTETDSILVVDPDALLTVTISPERLKAVPRRYPQVVDDLGLVESVEFPRSHFPQRSRQPLAGDLRVPTIEEVFGRLITEASDHGYMIARLSCYRGGVFAPDAGALLCTPDVGALLCWYSVRHGCVCIRDGGEGLFRLPRHF